MNTAADTTKVTLDNPLHDSNQGYAFTWATAQVESKGAAGEASMAMRNLAYNIKRIAFVPAKGETKAPAGRVLVMEIGRSLWDANPSLPVPAGRRGKGLREGFALAFSSALASALVRIGAVEAFSDKGKQKAKAQEAQEDREARIAANRAKGDKVAMAEARLARAKVLAARDEEKPSTKAKEALAKAVAILEEEFEGAEEVLRLLGQMASHLGWQD